MGERGGRRKSESQMSIFSPREPQLVADDYCFLKAKIIITNAAPVASMVDFNTTLI